MVCGIYSYRDIKNDFKVIYIGQSKNIYNRHRGHLADCARDNQQINRVIQADPPRYALQIEIECEPEQLDSFEQLFIASYNPIFNFTKGGKGEYPNENKKGKYSLWDNKKAYYISHKNQNRNKPFRLYYKGYHISCGYFHEWFTINKIHELIEEAID